jgi:hypothetical protein
MWLNPPRKERCVKGKSYWMESQQKNCTKNPEERSNIMNTGTSYGSGLTVFEGLRVAGETLYIPDITDAGGKTTNRHIRIPVYMNERRSDRPNRFSLTGWGKLADVCANLLAVGTEFNCKCRPNSYQGRVFDRNGQPLLYPDGSPITTEKVSFSIVMDFKIIADSRKTIEAEIAAGKRPMNWDDGGAGQEAWRQARKVMAAQQYVPGSTTFGHARVLVPTQGVATPAAGSNLSAEQLIQNPQVQAILAAAGINTTPGANPNAGNVANPGGPSGVATGGVF